MSAFKKVPKGKLGYEPSEVDAFIVRARDQYINFWAQILDWRDITEHKFGIVKGGYEMASVDVALDKLQDTFAQRELSKSTNYFAPTLSTSLVKELQSSLLGRASRPKNLKFDRSSVVGVGYSRKEVDALVSNVQKLIEVGEGITVDEVRSLSFKVKRRGYLESQVDSYVAQLVEYLQTLKFVEPADSGAANSSGGANSSPSGSKESREPNRE